MLDWFLGQPRTRAGQVDVLDGLRGLAVLIVIGSHLSNTGWLPQPGLSGTGKSGVYLFFVLSAYLLSRALLARPLPALADAGTWAHYALRRVLRIWPLYLFVLLLSWVLTRAGVAGWHYRIDTAALWRHLRLQEGQDVLWSIPVEFTFYLWLPLIVLALVAVRGLRGGRWWGLLLLAALAAAALWQWPSAQAPVNGVQLGYYLVVFLAGVAAAFVEQGWPGLARHARTWRWAGLALLTLLALVTPSVWARLAGTPFNPELNHRWFLGFGLGWAALLLAVCRGGGPLARLLRSAPMRLVGAVSFSAYLWHMPVLKAAAAVGLQRWGGWALPPLLAAILAMAAVSFLLFERPFRDLRYRRRAPARA